MVACPLKWITSKYPLSLLAINSPNSLMQPLSSTVKDRGFPLVALRIFPSSASKSSIGSTPLAELAMKTTFKARSCGLLSTVNSLSLPVFIHRMGTIAGSLDTRKLCPSCNNSQGRWTNPLLVLIARTIFSPRWLSNSLWRMRSVPSNHRYKPCPVVA